MLCLSYPSHQLVVLQPDQGDESEDDNDDDGNGNEDDRYVNNDDGVDDDDGINDDDDINEMMISLMVSNLPSKSNTLLSLSFSFNLSSRLRDPS